MKPPFHPWLLSAALALPFLATPSQAAECSSLSSLQLPNVSITLAQDVAAGSFRPPEGSALPNVVAFCRVTATLKPSADSDIKLEVWLPKTGWNGKFEGVGNGGYAGTVNYTGLADAINNGYATASTDTGHHSLNNANADWALHHPEKVADFAWRAIHEMTADGKAIARAYYGSAPKYSYFSSCSNGGRQALVEAQRFPADYDGLVAGAPANNWTHLLSGAAHVNAVLLSSPETYISANKLQAIENAALAACDDKDGVKDGVIDDPRRCDFDPTVLLCKSAETESCLTLPQIDALKKIYAGPYNAKGEQMYPGYSVGGQAGLTGWASWITGMAPQKSLLFSFGTGFFQNMVYENGQWDFRKFDVSRDVKEADAKDAALFNATNPDLSAFKKHGGKLILYHGWDDPAIPAMSTVGYYESILAKMGKPSADAFIRLYMVPGMQHCALGPGPDSFGQLSAAPAAQSVHTAIVEWVENKKAPGSIVATKYKSPMRPESGAVRTRPLCPYPAFAHWSGSGNTDDAANFTCETAPVAKQN